MTKTMMTPTARKVLYLVRSNSRQFALRRQVSQDGGAVQVLEDELAAIPGGCLRVLTAWDSSGRSRRENEHISR